MSCFARRLSAPRVTTRLRALRIIGAFPGHGSIPPVTACLDDENQAVRSAARVCLDRLDTTAEEWQEIHTALATSWHQRRVEILSELDCTPSLIQKVVDQGDCNQWGGDEPVWIANPVEVTMVNPAYTKLKQRLEALDRDLDELDADQVRATRSAGEREE